MLITLFTDGSNPVRDVFINIFPEVSPHMSAHLTRRSLLTAMGASTALWLTGCATTSPDTTPEEPAGPAMFTNVGSRAKPAAAAKAKRLSLPVVDAFKGDGIWFFDDDEGAQFRITDLIRENNRHPVVEQYGFGKPHGFSWGTGAVGIMRNGRRVPPEHPVALRPEGDHVVIEFEGDEKLELYVTLEAYDVSGLMIRDYLRTRSNMPTTAALFMGGETFPAGSVAYATTLWVKQDELLAVSNSAFTGSNTIEAFSERFTKETPYCLNALPADDAMPVGIRFDKAIKKKMGTEKVKQKKGTRTVTAPRSVELAQDGTCRVYRAKKGTIFCQKEQSEALALAQWQLRYVNGTRTLMLDFPDLVDALSIGVMTANRGKLMPAFVEEKTTLGFSTRVIPSLVWLKDKKIRDAQYRFNKTAALAIEAAIKAARPKRTEWENANESEVTRRARALQAKKAAAAEAKRTKPKTSAKPATKTRRKTTVKPATK